MPRLAIALTTLVVPDYDSALEYFVKVLGFDLREDTQLDAEKRWVVVAPTPSSAGGLLLAKAANDEQQQRVGNQTGGRVAFFLSTDDFDSTYAEYLDRGVNFCESPRVESYGKAVVFEDPFGNRWDLIEHT